MHSVVLARANKICCFTENPGAFGCSMLQAWRLEVYLSRGALGSTCLTPMTLSPNWCDTFELGWFMGGSPAARSGSDTHKALYCSAQWCVAGSR